MDFDKLYQDIINKKFTDLELILTDQHQSIHINVHKIILAYNSVYFFNLFTFNDAIGNILTVNVPNAKIAHDIVLSFYNQKINSTDYPDWKYLLETIKCQNYFCLDVDVEQLYNLMVPIDGFELLLEIMDLFDPVNDVKLMQTIKRNMCSFFPLVTKIDK